MNGWEIAIIVIMALGQGVACAKHGEQERKYNWYYSLISRVIWLFLMYMAGLFH